MELTKEQLDQIKGVISETLKASNVEMTKAFEAKITEAVTPIASRIEQVEGKVKDAPAPTATKTGDPLGGGGGGGGGGGENKAVLDAIKALTDKVDGVVNERSAEQSRGAAKRLVDETVAKKYPNLKGKPAVLAKLYAGEPKDEAALDALVEREKAYARDLGLDLKIFGAEPADENGKPGEGSEGATEDEKNKARAEEIKKRREAKSAR